jgi:transcriptional regulator with XRE-family HTH domain
MQRSGTPVGQQWRLQAALRRSRAACGLSLRAVASALEWSDAKLSRIESGSVRISVTDLRALLQYYDVTEPNAVAEFVELARASRRTAWWDEYRPHFKPDFIRFLGLEWSAARIRQFQHLLVPGLLQVPEYTRAIVSVPAVADEQVERDVAIRARRQDRLVAGDADFAFVLDESVLHRRIGGPSTWRRQLAHLQAVAARPNVSIQVLPYEAGFVHSSMAGSFELFDLSADEPASAVLLEHPEQDTLIIGNETRAAGYVAVFQQLSAAALTPADTHEVIGSMLR